MVQAACGGTQVAVLNGQFTKKTQPKQHNAVSLNCERELEITDRFSVCVKELVGVKRRFLNSFSL